MAQYYVELGIKMPTNILYNEAKKKKMKPFPFGQFHSTTEFRANESNRPISNVQNSVDFRSFSAISNGNM